MKLHNNVFGKTIFVIVLILSMLVAPAYASGNTDANVATQQAPCNDTFDHHSVDASPYFNMLSSGKVWNKGLDFIAAVYVADCGRYLIGIWRGGQFTTHFLASWDYVINQARGFARSSWAKLMAVWLLYIVLPCPGSLELPPCPRGQA